MDGDNEMGRTIHIAIGCILLGFGVCYYFSSGADADYKQQLERVESHVRQLEAELDRSQKLIDEARNYNAELTAINTELEHAHRRATERVDELADAFRRERELRTRIEERLTAIAELNRETESTITDAIRDASTITELIDSVIIGLDAFFQRIRQLSIEYDG